MYEELRALPLVQILSALGFHDYKETSKGWQGACPFHGPKSNKTSFGFTADGVFNCLSCLKHGKGAIDLVKAVRQCGFQEAVEWLKSMKPVTTPQVELSGKANEMVSENPPYKGSYEKFYVRSEWLAKRGILPATLEKFGVGQYDNPKRQSVYKGKILFPIRRWKDSELVGYLARNPEGEPKYIFPKNFHKGLELFGCHLLKEKCPHRVVAVVESPFAVMKLSELGQVAVSPFGWSISDEQISILKELAKGILFLPDRDKWSEAQQYVGKIAAAGLWTKMPPLPDGVDDPEYLSVQQLQTLLR